MESIETTSHPDPVIRHSSQLNLDMCLEWVGWWCVLKVSMEDAISVIWWGRRVGSGIAKRTLDFVESVCFNFLRAVVGIVEKVDGHDP